MKKKKWSILSWYKQYKGLNTVLWFGKYKGRAIKEVILCDVQYIEWCVGKGIFKLGIIANIYYIRKLNIVRVSDNRWRRAMWEFEQTHGKWMDDGKGNSGFVKETYD